MARAHPYDRDAALDAAMTLFWAKGYHATSLKDLESALSMKPGSIYAAFSSKEALFRAALEKYFTTMNRALRSDLDDAESPLAALAGYIRVMPRSAPDNPQQAACMLVKTLLGITSADDIIADDARQYLDRMLAEFEAQFERSKRLGELPADTDCRRLARRYQSDISALKIEMHRGTDADELAALADDMASQFEALRVTPA
ncbi:TetR/AcrR family transcriptional regulator [Hyphomonas johnsonii]|uniref:TetR family transcriptional regulator n=1 Tax=Hyphomonas johnsonii MHS-2 TaxID=1280950 RepID=A0A059FSX7_9PROT|nr:TetR/AcrR family transcriptional regulator [Hyphomonas johnsonii]KCZ93805.1 TetR family transcriptional regulator [Hyphomonas johnsonii MHS-2]